MAVLTGPVRLLALALLVGLVALPATAALNVYEPQDGTGAGSGAAACTESYNGPPYFTANLGACLGLVGGLLCSKWDRVLTHRPGACPVHVA